MQRVMCKSLIHHATVTRADLRHEASIMIDADLMDAADIHEFERVQIVDVTGGARFETYAVPAPRGSGDVVLAGVVAEAGLSGNVVSIVSFATYGDAELMTHRPCVVCAGAGNVIAHRTGTPYWTQCVYQGN